MVSAPPCGRFSRLYPPARSRFLLRFAAEVALGCARTGFPGGELLPGQDLLDKFYFLHLAHLLPSAGLTGAPHPRSVLGAPRLRAARPSLIARYARSGRGRSCI